MQARSQRCLWFALHHTRLTLPFLPTLTPHLNVAFHCVLHYISFTQYPVMLRFPWSSFLSVKSQLVHLWLLTTYYLVKRCFAFKIYVVQRGPGLAEKEILLDDKDRSV